MKRAIFLASVFLAVALPCPADTESESTDTEAASTVSKDSCRKWQLMGYGLGSTRDEVQGVNTPINGRDREVKVKKGKVHFEVPLRSIRGDVFLDDDDRADGISTYEWGCHVPVPGHATPVPMVALLDPGPYDETWGLYSLLKRYGPPTESSEEGGWLRLSWVDDQCDVAVFAKQLGVVTPFRDGAVERGIDPVADAYRDSLEPGVRTYGAEFVDGSTECKTWVRMVRASALEAGEWSVDGRGLVRRSGKGGRQEP